MDRVDLRNQGEFLRIEEEKRFLKLINCEVHTFGDVPKRGLIVCNHLSYLDVLVLLKACPAAFVAKNEVRRWPFFGLLHGGDTPSGSSCRYLPGGNQFRWDDRASFSNPLLEAAILASRPITPTAIGYEIENGSVANEICYWRDMVFYRHFWNLLGKRSIRAVVRFGSPHEPVSGRKQHAHALHLAVIQLRNDHHLAMHTNAC